MSAWPAEGKPGDPAYDALSARDKDAATLVFVDAGKAIASHAVLLPSGTMHEPDLIDVASQLIRG